MTQPIKTFTCVCGDTCRASNKTLHLRTAKYKYFIQHGVRYEYKFTDNISNKSGSELTREQMDQKSKYHREYRAKKKQEKEEKETKERDGLLLHIDRLKTVLDEQGLHYDIQLINGHSMKLINLLQVS